MVVWNWLRAKTKVASIKKTIPRLKLCAAVLLAELLHYVLAVYKKFVSGPISKLHCIGYVHLHIDGKVLCPIGFLIYKNEFRPKLPQCSFGAKNKFRTMLYLTCKFIVDLTLNFWCWKLNLRKQARTPVTTLSQAVTFMRRFTIRSHFLIQSNTRLLRFGFGRSFSSCVLLTIEIRKNAIKGQLKSGY